MDSNAQNNVVEEMQKFIDDLVSARFAGGGITDEVRKELVKDATERLQQFIIESTLDKLSDQDVDTFAKMVEEKKSPQELQKFTTEHIPDYQNVMQNALQKFQEIYLS